MKKQLLHISVSDTGFLFDSTSGQTFRVNQTGLSIVQMLQDGITLEKAPSMLKEKFNVEAENVTEDIREFISLMNDLGLKVENI